MRKQNATVKPQTRQIAPGITLTGVRCVEQYDEQLRKKVAARRKNEYAKEIRFVPDFAFTDKQ